jgi:hypothetical protein
MLLLYASIFNDDKTNIVKNIDSDKLIEDYDNVLLWLNDH